MLNLQSNTQRGRKAFATQANFSGLEGLLAKIVNVAGVANLALPTGPTDPVKWIIEDGGFDATPASGYAAAATPIWPERNFRVWLNGTCNPGDTLVLANPAAILIGGSFTTPDGGVFTTPAGFLQAAPPPGNGLVLGTITLTGGKITNVAVVSGGSNFSTGQFVYFQDATGVGAVGVINAATVAGVIGVVQSITIYDGGAGYTAPSPVIPQVTYRQIGVAEEAGVSGQLVLFRPDGGLIQI